MGVVVLRCCGDGAFVVVAVVVVVMRGNSVCDGFCGVVNWCGGSYIYQHHHYHHQHHHHRHQHHHNHHYNHHHLNCFYFVSKFSQFQISFGNILFFILVISLPNFAKIQRSWTFFNSQDNGLFVIASHGISGRLAGG